MSIKVSTMEIWGNTLLGENRLPQFRDKIQNKELEGDGLLDEEWEKYGYQTGKRVLPYLVQDVYSRDRSMVSVKSIEFENEHLKAVFLPEYGMRLFSLYNKDKQREILFKNSALQFANLAIRDAWFSGGIEWNIGQLGHTFTTCDNLFAAVCHDGEGREFLRCYEYERCKGVYWQIDFYLEGDLLAAYVRFINPKEESVPFYWWTNIAVPEEKRVRIFSGNANVIYINPSSNEASNAKKGMSHGVMPYLDSLPGQDASYPQNFDFSSEYFFQNEKDTEQTWEAAAYNDNTLFFDCASDRLRYHKMFCWGVQPGGQHWKDFLSNDGKGDYVELQAGLCPTQVHGMDMPGKTTWDFVQVFGGMDFDYKKAEGEWSDAQQRVHEAVKNQCSPAQIDALLERCRKSADAPIEDLLHMGSGYGALEEVRCPGCSPKGLWFPKASISPVESVWVELLEKKRIEDLPLSSFPRSYMVDARYGEALKEAAEQGGYTAQNLYGVFCMEEGRTDEAVRWFERSIESCENPLALRNLFCVYQDTDLEKAAAYMEKALALQGEIPEREFVEEYTLWLDKTHQHEKLWNYYENLPQKVRQNERVILNTIPAAVTLRKTAFLGESYKRNFTHVREGERIFTECYFVYQALLEAETTGAEFNDALVQKYVKKNEVPRNIDFRQSKI